VRIVIVQRGGGDPYNVHTYFIDDRETVEALDELLKKIQSCDGLPRIKNVSKVTEPDTMET